MERLACTHILTVQRQDYVLLCSACEGPFVTATLRKPTTDLSFRILLWDFTKSKRQHPYRGPGYLSRYSDWLRAGRSGDRVPMKARISAPGQTVPGAHPAPIQ